MAVVTGSLGGSDQRVDRDAGVLGDEVNLGLGLGVPRVELASLVGERGAEVSRDRVGLRYAAAIVLDGGRQIGRKLGEVLGSAGLAVGVHLLEVDAGALEHAARAGGVPQGG